MRWCGSHDRDPDDMDKWAQHLAAWHGYGVSRTGRTLVGQPRIIVLEQLGWSDKAKFYVNQRVNVKADSKPRDYTGRRGTVVGGTRRRLGTPSPSMNMPSAVCSIPARWNPTNRSNDHWSPYRARATKLT